MEILGEGVSNDKEMIKSSSRRKGGGQGHRGKETQEQRGWALEGNVEIAKN